MIIRHDHPACFISESSRKQLLRKTKLFSNTSCPRIRSIHLQVFVLRYYLFEAGAHPAIHYGHIHAKIFPYAAHLSINTEAFCISVDKSTLLRFNGFYSRAICMKLIILQDEQFNYYYICLNRKVKLKNFAHKVELKKFFYFIDTISLSQGKLIEYKASGFGVTWKEFKQQFVNFVRSAAIGTGVGILPGLGAGISNLISYSVAKDYNNGHIKSYVRFFEELLMSYVTLAPGGCNQAPKCIAAPVVEHTGDVYPCDFFVESNWYLGNIADQSLQSMLDSSRYAAFYNSKRDVGTECADCKWLCLCNGDCKKNRSTGEKSYFCEGYKLFFAHSHKAFLKMKQDILSQNSKEGQYYRQLNHMISRNDKCPCGSGNKYKKCCMPIKAI